MKFFSLATAAIIAFIGVIGHAYMSWLFGGQMAIYFSPSYTFDDIPNLTGKILVDPYRLCRLRTLFSFVNC
jgi:hypothetical protein